MRKILLLSLIFLVGFGTSSFAQINRATKTKRFKAPKNLSKQSRNAIVLENEVKQLDLSNVNLDAQGPIHYTEEQVNNRTDEAYPIGSTYYDLQTNGTICNRLVGDGMGSMSATWTMAQDPGWGDRGTGYTHFNGAWGPPPATSLESVRTGWPNIGKLDNGNEIIISHTGDYTVSTLIGNGALGLWDETYNEVDSVGILWNRLVTSGNDIHMIGVSTPVSFGGSMINGVDGQLLYSRSTDGGDTWDIAFQIIPGLDSTNFLSIPNDAYSIAVNDNGTVAVGVWGGFENTEVYISNDNGENWTRRIVFDFPLDKYTADDGYTVDDIPYPADWIEGQDSVDISDSLTIETSDGSGAIMVSEDGTVHVTFGEGYVLDTDLEDGNTSFWIGGGQRLRYWNSGWEDNSSMFITELYEDPNDEDDEYTFCPSNDIGSYLTALCGLPSFATDSDGNIWISYISLMDGLCSEGDQNFNHIHLIRSEDGGESWCTTFDAINSSTYEDPDILSTIETTYPSMLPKIEDQIHLIYQQDGNPGQSLSDDEDAVELNAIYYAAIDVADVIANTVCASSAAEIEEMEDAFAIAPNPASDQVNISYILNDKSDIEVSIMNINGQVIANVTNETQLKGSYSLEVNVANYTAGVYLVQFKSGKQISTQKLVIK